MSDPMRGEGIALPPGRTKLGLPPRPFLFTRDQIAGVLDLQPRNFNDKYVYYEGRTVGAKSKHLLVARNIAPPNESPEWRITEREFIRWMKVKGFRYYDRGAFSM